MATTNTNDCDDVTAKVEAVICTDNATRKKRTHAEFAALQNTETIIKFSNRGAAQTRFLSNFHPCDVMLRIDNNNTSVVEEMFGSVEAAFHAAKFSHRTEFSIRLLPRFQKVKDAAAAKKLGSRKSIPMSPEEIQAWNKRRVKVMVQLVTDKFTRNPDLGIKLLETGDAALIECGFRIDEFWGATVKNGGANVLGQILMAVRDAIRDSTPA